MKVRVNYGSTCNYGDLMYGDVFVYLGQYYMKVQPVECCECEEELVNTVCLTEGHCQLFSESDRVYAVDTELVILP